MATVNLYVDLLTQRAIRSPTSASPAARPDFRDPTTHTLNVYFMRRNDNSTENYSYTRFSAGTPQAKLRRNKSPDYGSFVLSFAGYDSPSIDMTLTVEGITKLIESMPSIGAGNISIAGDRINGWTLEFVNALAGYVQPLFTGRMSSGSGEVVIREQRAGGIGFNEIQTIKLREAPLAAGTSWTELTSGSNWGWTASLNTTSIPQSIWDKGDLILDITLEATGVRTGTDGITALEGTSRSGADGSVVAVGIETGRLAAPKADADGRAYLVAQDGAVNYGTLFKPADIGRSVSNCIWTMENTSIAQVIDLPYMNAAILDLPFLPQYQIDDPLVGITFDLGGSPSRTYKSATAAFTVNDVGHGITGTDIPTGTTIESWIDAGTVKLSQVPVATGSGKPWTITAIAGNIFQSATAAFVAGDVGARLEAPQVQQGTVVASLIDATHVTMSQKAINAATGQSWTLRPKVGFAPPVVTTPLTGGLTSKERQTITLTQAPIGGFITIRDGGDITMPVVTVNAPINAQAIESAINKAYPNYRGVKVTELVTSGQWNIDFGVLGKQYTMVVDHSNAVYSSRMATIPVGAPIVTPPTPTFPPPPNPNKLAIPDLNIIIMGIPNRTYITRLAQPQRTRLTDGTKAREIRIKFAMVQDQFLAPVIGSTPPDNADNDFFFDHVDGIEDRGGMRIFDWVGYSMPSMNNLGINRTEIVQQQRPVYKVPIQIYNGLVVDIQIASVSQSTYLKAIYSYFRDPNDDPTSRPADGPFGSIIHFAAQPGFAAQSYQWTGGGFGAADIQHQIIGSGTEGREFNQSWTRRRWKADIWEQVLYVN